MEIKEHYGIYALTKINIGAITFGNHIFYSMDKDKIPFWLRNHELIHVRQYRENGIVKFLLLYIYYYLLGILNGNSSFESYRNIPFEVEARKIAGR